MSYIKAITWFKNTFADDINQRIQSTPYSLDFITASAVKETSVKWVNWIDKYDTQTILARCVFDPSGDYPGTFRQAFPRNKHAFEERYPITLSDMLIHEYNLTRVMPQDAKGTRFSPAEFLPKGFGIFQYDLQNIVTDEEFFTKKLWYNFSDCLGRVINILDEKRNVSNDIRTIAKHYNGS